jgi:uncharacterized membrane protein
MDSSGDSELDERLAKIEAAIAGLQRSMDAVLAQRGPAFSPRAAEPPREQRERFSADAAPSPGSPSPKPSSAAHWNATADPADPLSSWFTSRSAEWWLSRVGIGFVVLAVLLLYGYAIDKGWITPPIRVFAGLLVGALLFGAASLVPRENGPAGKSDLGFRELLFGGGLAIWYVTAYAAAVWYQLIPIPVARLALFVLGIVSTWIALEEHRAIFAIVAVASGFATPFILPAPVESMTEMSLYLGAVAAIGLMIYMMRGWHSILWITFIAFWMIVATQTSPNAFGSVRTGSVALSLLVLAGGAAFTRAPLLRRQLLALGSPRYTATPITGSIQGLMEAIDSFSAALGGGKSASDSLIVWLLTLSSPILAVGFLGQLWPSVPDEVSGLVLVLLGAGALALFTRGSSADSEIAHVELTAAVFWTLIGVGRIAPNPESLSAYAALGALVIDRVPRRFAGPRGLAKLFIGLSLLSIAGHELSFADTGLTHVRWLAAGTIALAAAAFIARRLLIEPAEESHGKVLAVAGYLTGLIILWRVLEPIWPPLVTASYALVGAGLLILSRREGGYPQLKYMGGATMVIVVGRLLLVDLSSVEAIWRVLLFLACGAVFLYTGYRMQAGRAKAGGKTPPNT